MHAAAAKLLHLAQTCNIHMQMIYALITQTDKQNNVNKQYKSNEKLAVKK